MESFNSGAWRSLGRGEIFIGGQWKRITRAEAYKGGQWRAVAKFVETLTASVVPATAEGYANPLKPVSRSITTNTVTATPAGGLGPYSYVWSSGNTTTLATNSFTRTVPADTEIIDTASVTITDSLGAVAVATVNLSFVNQSQLA